MKQKLEEIRAAAHEALAGDLNLDALEQLRIKYLGKKGEITAVLKGMGKLTAEDVLRALETGDRKLAGKTLPARGLHLVSVEYAD